MSGEKEEFPITWINFSIGFVSTLGVLGNILVLRVLLQRHMRNTFNKLRSALAVFDTLHCIAWVMDSILEYSVNVYTIATPYMTWPMANFAYTASIFMTMAIALERFVAINDPHNYRMNRRYRTRTYVCSVTIAAILLNISKFFEFEEKTDSDSPKVLIRNGLKFSELEHDKRYAIYNTVVYNMLLRAIIPITVLVFIYTKIYMKLKKSNLEQNKSKNEANERRRTREEKMAYTFVGVVVTSLVVAIINSFFPIAFLALGLPRDKPQWLLFLGFGRGFFNIINSVANIVIYTLLDIKFRQDLKNIFQKVIRCYKPKDNYAPSNTISMTPMEIKTEDTQTGGISTADRKDKGKKRKEDSDDD